MEQVQMEHWKMDIEKINGFNFLNEEAGEFTRRWIQNLVNVRNPSYLKQKIFEYCLWGKSRLYIQLFIRT